MPRSLLTQAAHDLVEDIAHHAITVTHAAFDFACVVALALMVYASGVAGVTADRPLPDVQASVNPPPAPACLPSDDYSASPDRDCITAVVLSALDA